jgi:hypothetical protein
MRALFYLGITGLFLFEVANVYFIMPFPGSQEMDTLSLAYFLYSYRWFIRVALGLMIVAGLLPTFRKNKWAPSILLLLVGAATYFINSEMRAEAMFHQPSQLSFGKASETKLPPDAVVIAVANNGEAKAFPVRYISYHHQVRDTIGGKSLLVTYCDVCRSGYVFEPVVDGKEETFRLVGMDHFNAMLEDHTTGSWWRQATGEAVTGDQEGKQLPVFPSRQMSLAEFFALYPAGMVMQPDATYAEYYDNDGSFENGKDTDELTRTDTLSWKEKSWVVGIEHDGHAKAYDWNDLRRERIINDTIGKTPVVIVLLADEKSFFAFQRPGEDDLFLGNDSLCSSSECFALGTLPVSDVLTRLPANQVFWHTWRTFHPGTTRR